MGRPVYVEYRPENSGAPWCVIVPTRDGSLICYGYTTEQAAIDFCHRLERQRWRPTLRNILRLLRGF